MRLPTRLYYSSYTKNHYAIDPTSKRMRLKKPATGKVVIPFSTILAMRELYEATGCIARVAEQFKVSVNYAGYICRKERRVWR